ncbi:serine/threonine-protein phosphatase 2A activator 1 [Coprinopsis cinerea okayama7|uniref:Serine/threonine-protein phosphatase 2A activator n=1 Tax=Coprinopsis cinerea (strain Okayama-7 / 130 / ATCC MYA-4618 / FGSC 9003) TaxID=240176 RepID=A8NVH6_COPC7|nr:serine/threonine-protein phosphatase 2A activator 1 [Coprinopsis cinerea okayama7\|eukprot:XP_001836716.2 serine/threonine-protein phosphatase 2A activator 1 [Coprinopsis cinerea okayama7\
MAELRKISLDDAQHLIQAGDVPVLRIKLEEDVEKWKTTQSYQDYGIFLRRLSDSVVNYQLPWSPTEPTEATRKLLSLLDTLDQWATDIPPLQTPQRFGNLAFRTWGQRLEERSQSLLEDLLGPEYSSLTDLVRPYFLTSFGSFTRMDYGTGHETSFALFLLCLTLVRYFQPIPEVEREIVLVIFLRYLRLCWRLQDTYRLEPAGSHGVWGLDDSHFLPYIFGSAQLRDQTDIPVNAVLQKPLPETNLYFLSISRIHEVKHGPFHEHSSSLHSIAVGVPNWGKVHSGLFKMYEAEVLGKRVVVQHIPLGGLLKWDPKASSTDEASSRHPQAPAHYSTATAAPTTWTPLPTIAPRTSHPSRRPDATTFPAPTGMPPPTSFPRGPT